MEFQPWSAPAFDERTVQSQRELYCMASGTTEQDTICTRVTEQGAKAKISIPVCVAIARDGPAYHPYRAPRQKSQQHVVAGATPSPECCDPNAQRLARSGRQQLAKLLKLLEYAHLQSEDVYILRIPNMIDKSCKRLIVDDPEVADHHVGQVFVAAADKGFRSLDVFVTWFTAGTAAALGLAAANLPKLEGLVSMAAVKAAIPWLGIALLLVLLSKFFGSVICTMAGAAEEGRRLQREALAQGELLPSRDAYLAAARRATPWPLRPFTKPGPLGRAVMRRLMLSGLSALLAATCVVIFWAVLLSPSWD